MKRKAEITFEVEETIVLRTGEKKFRAFCPQCETLVEMTTPQAAAALFGVSEREIFRLIEAAAIHFTEAERLYVCRKSLENKPPPGGLLSGTR